MVLNIFINLHETETTYLKRIFKIKIEHLYEHMTESNSFNAQIELTPRDKQYLWFVRSVRCTVVFSLAIFITAYEEFQ